MARKFLTLVHMSKYTVFSSMKLINLNIITSFIYIYEVNLIITTADLQTYLIKKIHAGLDCLKRFGLATNILYVWDKASKWWYLGFLSMSSPWSRLSLKLMEVCTCMPWIELAIGFFTGPFTRHCIFSYSQYHLIHVIRKNISYTGAGNDLCTLHDAQWMVLWKSSGIMH